MKVSMKQHLKRYLGLELTVLLVLAALFVPQCYEPADSWTMEVEMLYQKEFQRVRTGMITHLERPMLANP